MINVRNMAKNEQQRMAYGYGYNDFIFIVWAENFLFHCAKIVSVRKVFCCMRNLVEIVSVIAAVVVISFAWCDFQCTVIETK